MPQTVHLPDVYFEFTACKNGIARVCLDIEPVRGANKLTKATIDWAMEVVRQLTLDRLKAIPLMSVILSEQKKDPGFMNPNKFEHLNGKIRIHLN